ncbi:histidine kinase-like protein [Murinocardiopsis flavida]|uniref:Histidine kinase-like protein n=1 Tax=Murinocardiopsis flavida TaxID=645275 RepID=A0A2P8D252_9ACTN|nr:ATP-binding protein [Murinocardiopsis flavida]PSK91279.1 histidine kinase-like protein [Murinocardiopsis flavida]
MREWASETVFSAEAQRCWWIPALHNGPRGWQAHGGASHDTATWTLEPELVAVKIGRELSMAVLREWNMVRFAGDVELVVSELITNALRHGLARGDAHNVTQLSIMRRGGQLVCAVRDGSDEFPTEREPDFLMETGRGLNLVRSFSRRWGALAVPPHGKFVWALFE